MAGHRAGGTNHLFQCTKSCWYSVCLKHTLFSYTQMLTHTITLTHTHAHTHMLSHTHTYTHTHTRTHTLTHTHATLQVFVASKFDNRLKEFAERWEIDKYLSATGYLPPKVRPFFVALPKVCWWVNRGVGGCGYGCGCVGRCMQEYVCLYAVCVGGCMYV